MTAGLAVSDVVAVNVTLSPVATSTRNFGAFLIVGYSTVLAATENLRLYTSLTGVGNDFATTTPEYQAAVAFFSQSPQPSTCYIGAVRTASSETLSAAIIRLAGASGDWYGMTVASAILQSDSIILAAAQTVEALSPVRAFFYTSDESTILTAGTTTDLASTMQAATLTRSALQYTSAANATPPTSTLFAAASLFGRIATVNWSGNATALTLKFQQEPGIVAETLGETQAATLISKNCNAFVTYQNGASILQPGVMCSGIYIDERVGMDWLQNALQVAGFNALYNAGTKVPQTDAGMTTLAAAYTQVLDQGVANGMIAPGIWTGPAFGSLSNGQALVKGYYVYMPPVSTQTAADRAARRSVVATIAIKLAGAVHSAVVNVNVVR